MTYNRAENVYFDVLSKMIFNIFKNILTPISIITFAQSVVKPWLSIGMCQISSIAVQSKYRNVSSSDICLGLQLFALFRLLKLCLVKYVLSKYFNFIPQILQRLIASNNINIEADIFYFYFDVTVTYISKC